MMDRLTVVPVFALISCGLFGADMTREAKAEKILDLTNARAMQEQVLGQMKQMMAQQIGNLPPDQKEKAAANQTRILEMVASRINWDKIRPMMVKIWSETFTDQELDGILAFYESPAGRSMIQKMPALMMKSMQQMQGIMAEMQPEIEKIIKDQAGK